MTHHERLSLGVSTAALVISIISPFANYYWFQSEVRIRQLKAEAFRVEGNIYDCPRLQTILFDIVIKNTGVWPIDHVGLVIQKTMQTVALNQKDFKLTSFSFEKGNIQPEPALDVQIKEKKHEIVVHFQEALPPNSDVRLGALQFRNISAEYMNMLPDFESLQPHVWVSSEVSALDLDWNLKGTDCSAVKLLRTRSSRR